MKILVAVEDKMFGDALVDFISHHMWADDTQFKIVHVVEPVFIGNLASAYSAELLTNLIDEKEKLGKELVGYVSQAVKKACPNNTIEEVVIHGLPKEEILNTANEWPADLIIMGSHGRTGIDKFLMGSVSMAVLSHAPCSTCVVRLSKSSSH
jgi:nucleotide-binding universal stress UspA family protein